jgi:hypothetical protein
MNFDRIIEQAIRAAQEEGKFANLRGHGQPLRLDDNPFEDPAEQMSHHLLKQHGFRPDWLETDVAIRAGLDQARQALARARDWRTAELAALGQRAGHQALETRNWVAHEWAKAQARFRAEVGELNKAIFNLNLKVPQDRLQRHRIDVEKELAQVLAAGAGKPLGGGPK